MAAKVDSCIEVVDSNRCFRALAAVDLYAFLPHPRHVTKHQKTPCGKELLDNHQR
jgi:hypothetical protein